MASWDLFCSVVDNYGDIGVTWRLARQLVAEHGQQVRLWVDDLSAFVPLCPEADAQVLCQWQAGVEVRHWGQASEQWQVAEVVIEAFACQLPEAYLQAMAHAAKPPLWLNLEYLSAETWVDDCHGLPSLQAKGLQKYFYFPGFRPSTGGLLRESGLLRSRDTFQADTQAQADFLGKLGVQVRTGERRISLFAYRQPALGEWLDTLAQGPLETLLLVPQGLVLADLEAWLGQPLLTGAVERGRLRVQALPFVRQEDYDRLLWCCDINVVRGEDSFVRAQWAGRPFIWHIYPQQEGAHLEKLEAFLDVLAGILDSHLQAKLRDFWLAWNAQGCLASSWQALEPLQAEWTQQMGVWQRQLSKQEDLATGLVHFYTNWL